MTRARKVENAKHYHLIVDNDTLSQFVKITRTDDTGPSDIMRCLIQNYTDVTKSGKIIEGSVTDKLLNVIEHIETISDKDGFLLSELDLPEADKALKSLMKFHDYYYAGKLKSVKKVHVSENEYLTIRKPSRGTCTISTTANNCKIRYHGLKTKVKMSDEYNEANLIHKQCVVADLLRTLNRIAEHYSNDLYDRLMLAGA